MAPIGERKQRFVILKWVVAACACVPLARKSIEAFAAGTATGGVTHGGPRLALRRASPMDNLISDPKALEEMMKDPDKLKAMQADVEKIMSDPKKKAAMEQWSNQIQGAVEKLKEDPEMKAFFEDVEKNGIAAMEKYQKDERILRKFSEATGGPESIANMMGGPMGGMMGGMGGPTPPAPGQVASFKPGDEVIISGLKAKPELNGKKAMVVPPTAEEKETLAGTGRLIVRMMDTGEQFAVKPDNLKTTAEEADSLMGSKLEDVSMYNPALQTEAAKLRDSGKLEDLQNDPELQPIFEDIRKNGMSALEKYWDDEKLMAKISKAMGTR